MTNSALPALVRRRECFSECMRMGVAYGGVPVSATGENHVRFVINKVRSFLESEEDIILVLFFYLY